MTEMVNVTIVGLQLAPDTAASVVLLGESAAPDRVLPILIGPAEAQAIAIGLSGFTPPRPLTHDLLVALADASDSRVEQVAITELVDGVFHADLFVETPSGLRRVSARPSDAIAIAVRVECPIVVATAVLSEAAVEVDREPSESFSDEEIDSIVADFQRRLDSIEPSDFADDPSEGGQPEPE